MIDHGLGPQEALELPRMLVSGGGFRGASETVIQIENGFSPAAIRLWATQGVLLSDQRVSGSKLWVRVNDDDLTRLNGSLQYTHLPTITDLMTEHQITRNEVWALVRAGHYLPY